jgi:hypothetical protein
MSDSVAISAVSPVKNGQFEKIEGYTSELMVLVTSSEWGCDTCCQGASDAWKKILIRQNQDAVNDEGEIVGQSYCVR